MMIDGCLAWERKDTTREFSLSEQGRLMSGAGQFTQRSCLVWGYVGRSSSCFIVRRRLGVGSIPPPLIFPYPWVVLVVGVFFLLLLFLPPLWHSSFHGFLYCWLRVWSWLEFNVTNAVVGAGRERLDTHGLAWGAAFAGSVSITSVTVPPATPKREGACLIYRVESHHTATKSIKNGNKNNRWRNRSNVLARLAEVGTRFE